MWPLSQIYPVKLLLMGDSFQSMSWHGAGAFAHLPGCACS